MPENLAQWIHPALRGTWLRAALAILLLAAARPAEAAGPDHHTRTWTTDDGLPHNSVGSIVQDSMGFMWFATAGGLARFDGREFRELRPPQDGVGGFNIRGIAEERPGVLIVLPAGSIVMRLAGTSWSVHPVNEIVARIGDTPRDVYVDTKGSVWIALSGGRVLRWEPSGRHHVLETGDSNPVRRLRLAEDAGGMWIVGGDGLWFAAPDGSLRRFAPVAAEPRLIHGGRARPIWLLTDQHLYQLAEGRVVAERALPAGVDARGIGRMFEDSRGALWLATSRQGLLRFAEGVFERVTNFPSVAFVAEDREGNLWIATDGNGLGQLREKSHRLFDAGSGFSQDTVSTLAEDPAGRVWFANRSGGLMVLGADGRVEPGGPSGPPPFANVVCADADGRLWFGGGANGLLRWTPGSPAAQQMPAPDENLHLLFRARNGDIWYASDPGRLGYYRGDTLHRFGTAEGFRAQGIRAIAQDRAGDIWLGGRNGELVRWNGERFDVFDVARGFPRLPIHAICVDAEDRLWIGTADGLVLKDGDRFHLLTEAHGLADNIVLHLVADDRGFLWFAARRGLFYAALSELVATARGAPNSRVQSHRIGPSQGLVGLSPTANYFPGAVKTRDGRVWFAATQGAVAIDPSRVPADLPAPPVLIDEVRVDGEVLPAAAALRVPSARHRVEFKVAVLSYAAPESIVVRHQLEHIDREWIDTGSDRVVSYTNLPPGDYRFRVIARNSDGRWNSEGATLALTITPAWWETLAFRVGAIVLVIALSAWTARRFAQRRLHERLRRLEQEHALEKERQRIARDLHDDLGASLTELGLMADRLADRGGREMAPQLSLVAWHTRRLATELSGIVWTMSPRNASLDRMGEFIQRYATRLFHGLPIACLVRRRDPLPPLPLAPDLQHQIIAATREALNNVLKHSRATEVEVDLRYSQDCFVIAIADNGRGFPLATAGDAEGNGLRNMHTRAADIGATLEIDSAPGRGTRVTLSVPLHAPAAM